MNKEIFAPFEILHGFDNDCFLRNERSRFGEFQIKRGQIPVGSQQDALLLSRAQWKDRRRMVMDCAQAAKVVVSKSGHSLRLYSEAQTTKI